MLRITQNSHAGGAKSYYSSSSDYYVDGQQERAGVWRGEGAKLLGLTGEITRADWDAICDHLNPNTGEKLNQRRKDNASVGYDICFNAKKSLSVLYAATKDERLVDAFQSAVDSTMRDIESEMQTRVRKGGKNEDRRTGNMLWGEFTHLTARPVDGIPDSHLHIHCFAINLTMDSEERVWKAGQFRDIMRDAGYFQAMFHTRLARNLADLGLPIERSRHGFEISGVPKSLLQKFSRRTALIEEKAKEKGIDDPAVKGELGAKTRSRKAKNLTMPQLQAEWMGRMTPRELDALARLEKLTGSDAQPQDDNAAARAIDYAIGHEFERKSVVPERQLLTTALKQGVGHVLPEQLLKQAALAPLIVGERNGRRMATTREVISEEEKIIDYARSGRGTVRPLVGSNYKFKRDWLNASQQQAVRHILESRDRVTLVRGVAGVGKTSLMQEAVEAIEASGTKVTALAPTAEASRGVMRAEGFLEADTVARLLVDEQFQEKARGSLLWVDEAGLLGVKTMASLFGIAEKIDARILLTGDARQHGAVERGETLKLLETEAGIKPAEVKEIQRQKDEYKLAVRALADGKTAEGFSRLDGLGWIHELPEDERYKKLAANYVQSVSKGKSVLVVAPTHFEGHLATDAIREAMKEKGLIGRDELTFEVLKNANLTESERGDALNYLPGDILQFHQNARNFTRGERIEVNGEPLPLELANRFTAFHASTLKLAVGDAVRITQNGFTADKKHRLNNGSVYKIKSFDRAGNIVLNNNWVVAKDYGHLAQGFVSTSYGSQGKTVDRVLIAQSGTSYPASSREQFYVSCSRARESATIYCDDKQALREVIEQTHDRVSATEFVKERRRRELAAETNREHATTMTAERQERFHDR
jgi:conjugative relaxase-like TrwC/TraI family protein